MANSLIAEATGGVLLEGRQHAQLTLHQEPVACLPRQSWTQRNVPSEEQQSLNNPQRLERLRRSQLLDGATAPLLDRLTRLVSTMLDVPISLVSLVDNASQHFPGLTGLDGWAGERRGTALSHSFCQHVVTSNAPLIIENARSCTVVADNLAISRLGVVSYAGVPLRTADGHTLGALCAIDGRPRQWTKEQIAILTDVAAVAIAQIESHALQTSTLESPDNPPNSRDPMTGLLNGRGLLEYGEAVYTTGAKESAPVSVISLDIDGFGAFNNTFGYDCGNARLREAGDLLVSIANEQDVVARVGVDEFVVVLHNVDEARCLAFISSVREALAVRNSTHAPPPLTFTFGCATTQKSAPVPFLHQLRHAETEMYRTMDACTHASPSPVAI